jgi:3-hydroxyisobutyrate dehydrogenase-like beta-hydroxyacid dehydrogenase
MPSAIGFIGLGNMGHPIAANLLQFGHSLRVYNRTESKAAPLIQQGAALAKRPAEVAEPGGVVFTMVADDHALNELCWQPDSFVTRLGRGGIHISLSTISPETSRHLAEQHRQFGVEYVAAPVFGRPEAAAAKRLVVCVSGAARAKEAVNPLLTAISQAIFDFGEEVGAANVVKLCGNFLIGAAIEALAESLALAEKNGVPRRAVADMLTKTLFGCPVYQGYGKQIAEERYEPVGFRLPLGLKDVNLVLQTGAHSSVPLPTASLLRDRFLAAMAKGREHMDWTAIAIGISEDAGLKPQAGAAK